MLIHQGITVPCFRCKVPFTLDELAARKVQKEHVVELKLGGADMPENCRFSHTDCHAVITNGTKATTAGSSKNRLAKANNPNRRVNFIINKPDLAPVEDRQANKPRSKWTTGRKLRGKGFAKVHRPMQRRTSKSEDIKDEEKAAH